MLDLLFTIIFIFGIYYLLQYRLNLKKAAELSKDAIYPKKEEEFSSLLIPMEWKEMVPLTKNTRSYQYVKWGTVGALLLSTALLIIVLSTEWFSSSFFSAVYLFVVIISAIKHRGNLYILPKGIILHGKFYTFKQIKAYEVEKIIRWHELYGYDDRVNNAYKLTIKVKKRLFQPNFVVISDHNHLELINQLLEKQGIKGEMIGATDSSATSSHINT